MNQHLGFVYPGPRRKAVKMALDGLKLRTNYEVSLNTNEEFTIQLFNYGIKIVEYKMWSEDFEAWIKQDIDWLYKTYPTQYDEIANKLYKKLQERGDV